MTKAEKIKLLTAYAKAEVGLDLSRSVADNEPENEVFQRCLRSSRHDWFGVHNVVKLVIDLEAYENWKLLQDLKDDYLKSLRTAEDAA